MPAALFESKAVDDRPQQNALITLEATVDGQWIDYVIDLGRDVVLATGEHMMVHVDTVERSTPINDYMRDCLAAALHKWCPVRAPKGLKAAILGVQTPRAPSVP